jgi:DNA repair protein RecO (recombination protein O)
VLARGAATAKGERKAILQPFVPLLASWAGRGELKVLHQLETASRPATLAGKYLYCGFYLNELIMRLLRRHDPLPELFLLYAHTLVQLADGQDAETILRYFELGLLQALGYAPMLDREASSGQPIQQHKLYWYLVEAGPGSTQLEHLPSVHGETLLALSTGQSLTRQQKHEALRLMRYILRFYLGDKPLKSRELFG